MKTLKPPFWSKNQRIIPKDLARISEQVLNAVTNVCGHLLVDPAQNTQGYVAWGLTASAAFASSPARPMDVKVEIGAGILSGVGTEDDASTALVQLTSNDTQYVTLASAGVERTYVVYLVGTWLETGSEQRDFRSIGANGEFIEQALTPTVKRMVPSLVARYDGSVPANSIKLTTVVVPANAVSLAADNFTDARTMLWPGQATTGRGLRGALSTMRDQVLALGTQAGALLARIVDVEGDVDVLQAVPNYDRAFVSVAVEREVDATYDPASPGAVTGVAYSESSVGIVEDIQFLKESGAVAGPLNDGYFLVTFAADLFPTEGETLIDLIEPRWQINVTPKAIEGSTARAGYEAHVRIMGPRTIRVTTWRARVEGADVDQTTEAPGAGDPPVEGDHLEPRYPFWTSFMLELRGPFPQHQSALDLPF